MGRYEHHFSYNSNLQIFLLYIYLHIKVETFVSFFPIISGDRDKAPGQRECDYSIDNINKCIRDIEQASLAAVGQTLPCRDDISMEVSSNPPSSVSCVRGKRNLMRSVVFLLRLLL